MTSLSLFAFWKYQCTYLKKLYINFNSQVGRGKRNAKERPLSIDSDFGSSSFPEDVDDIPPTSSKSWFTKALRKVLKVPSTYNNKPIKQTVIEDQSSAASSNGYQEPYDVGNASFASKSDNIPMVILSLWSKGL